MRDHAEPWHTLVHVDRLLLSQAVNTGNDDSDGEDESEECPNLVPLCIISSRFGSATLCKLTVVKVQS